MWQFPVDTASGRKYLKELVSCVGHRKTRKDLKQLVVCVRQKKTNAEIITEYVSCLCPTQTITKIITDDELVACVRHRNAQEKVICNGP